MKCVNQIGKSAASFLALLLIFGIGSEASAAPHRQKAKPMATSNIDNGGTNAGGVGRGDNGQILRISVTFNGKPVAHAMIAVSVGDGSVVLRGVTLKNGIFSRNLDAGTFNVTATSGKNTATSSVTIVQSNDPAMVALALAPKK